MYAMAATFLSKIAADRSLSEIDLDKFQTEVTEYLKAPTTRDCLNDDIKKMTDMVMSIETCFADIHYQMTRIDDRKLVLDQDGHSIQFAHKWRVLHDVSRFNIPIIDTNLCAQLYRNTPPSRSSRR